MRAHAHITDFIKTKAKAGEWNYEDLKDVKRKISCAERPTLSGFIAFPVLIL